MKEPVGFHIAIYHTVDQVDKKLGSRIKDTPTLKDVVFNCCKAGAFDQNDCP